MIKKKHEEAKMEYTGERTEEKENKKRREYERGNIKEEKRGGETDAEGRTECNNTKIRGGRGGKIKKEGRYERRERT